MDKIGEKGGVMLPVFICPGAAKSGTTTLSKILLQHPDIYIPKIKETNFFTTEELFTKGIDWYDKCFYDISDNLIPGDISTGYLQYANIASERIYNALGPNVKYIFILRNPVKRAFSHYCMSRYNNERPEPEFDVLVKDLLSNDFKMTMEVYKELSKGYSHISNYLIDHWRFNTYFQYGKYYENIKCFEDYFHKKNFMFIKYEDFILNIEKYIDNILKFLNIESKYNFDYSVNTNSSSSVKYKLLSTIIKKVTKPKIIKDVFFKTIGYENSISFYYFLKNMNRKLNKPPRISSRTNEILKEFYIKDIKMLEEYTNLNLTDWYE